MAVVLAGLGRWYEVCGWWRADCLGPGPPEAVRLQAARLFEQDVDACRIARVLRVHQVVVPVAAGAGSRRVNPRTDEPSDALEAAPKCSHLALSEAPVARENFTQKRRHIACLLRSADYGAKILRQALATEPRGVLECRGM